MNITSTIVYTNLTSVIIRESINSTIKPTTIGTFHRLFNSTKIFPFLRPLSSTTASISSPLLLNKFFMFKSPFNYIMRTVELFILSLTLPLYAIVFTLFIELTIVRINTNTAISGGNSRSRSQRRRQRMRSLIWTSNYLLVDFLNLLYELIYVIIHLAGQLPLNSLAGNFYCQLQVYLPSYLAVLMAYSLTAVSIYRRRHFINLNNKLERTLRKSLLLISSLWLMPMVTSILPTVILVYLNILKVTQHETTNQCQISYTYESNVEAIYIFYRLGNIFLLPISISLACYITIYTDLIRTQRRFNRAFKRHVHIRKNLISQILFLFLNFAVFWLPAELITLYTKNLHLRDALQVTKSLNILLDPLIITGFDTRFSSAAKQLLSTRAFNGFRHCFNSHRQPRDSITTQTTTIRPFRRSQQLTLTSQQITTGVTRNMGTNDDITVLEPVTTYPSQQQKPKPKRSINQQQPMKRRRISTQQRMNTVGKHT